MSKKKAFLSSYLQNAVQKQEQTEEEIKQNIVILDELESLIPPLADDEYEQLKANILAEGCRDPLVLWQVEDRLPGYENKYILVDGHNRYSICTENNIYFKIFLADFPNLEAAKNWMIDNQLGRRNLTPEQQSYLRGKRYELEKAQGKRSDLENQTFGQNAQKSTAQRIAEEYNVDEKTIRRDAQFARGIDVIEKSNPELKQAILQGKTKVSKQDIQALASYLDEKQEIKIKDEADIKQKAKEAKQAKTKDAPKAKIYQDTEEQIIQSYRSSIRLSLDQAIEYRDALAMAKVKAEIAKLEKILFKN
ncbi:MAG: hypothetical protein NZ551_03525 [Microscillaceae bacterium]|nr:hypothetical protein [Microscillaceae bacterium]MDW8345371.1 hypothetical protein [Bacteroidia bacterium]MDW8460258.1 hypothetical protein [Cytophagales bacterium]